MNELQIIENDITALEEKIDAWFQKHFVSSASGTQAHAGIAKAHEELKAIVGITPPGVSVEPTVPANSSAS